jgi:hypothetical protein
VLPQEAANSSEVMRDSFFSAVKLLTGILKRPTVILYSHPPITVFRSNPVRAHISMKSVVYHEKREETKKGKEEERSQVGLPLPRPKRRVVNFITRVTRANVLGGLASGVDQAWSRFTSLTEDE